MVWNHLSILRCPLLDIGLYETTLKSLIIKNHHQVVGIKYWEIREKHTIMKRNIDAKFFTLRTKCKTLFEIETMGKCIQMRFAPKPNACFGKCSGDLGVRDKDWILAVALETDMSWSRTISDWMRYISTPDWNSSTEHILCPLWSIILFN